MVATSGAQLLAGDAVRNLRELLLPMTTVLTPNIPEATLLLRDADIQYRSPSTLEDLKTISKQLHGLGPKHILLKGGHMPLTKDYKKSRTEDEKAITVDILYPSVSGGDECEVIESQYLTIPNTHGTGCSLASALAANLASACTMSITTSDPNSHHSTHANQQSLVDSVRNAITYVSNGILTSTTLQSSLHNSGPGPINHLHSLVYSPFPLGHFIDYLLAHKRIAPIWDKYTHHPFTTALGNATLPLSTFKKYLVQDYLYLTHFARTYALASYKSTDMQQIASSVSIVVHIQKEMEMHLAYCEEMFGMKKAEIEAAPESQACTAYSRYVLDVGMRGDVLGLYVALAPCLIGYGVVAERLAAMARLSEEQNGGDGEGGNGGEEKQVANKVRREGNRYWKWVENYTAEDYREAVVKGKQVIEDEVVRLGGLGKGRAEELVEIFRRATEMEIAFWDIDDYGSAKKEADGGGSGDKAS